MPVRAGCHHSRMGANSECLETSVGVTGADGKSRKCNPPSSHGLRTTRRPDGGIRRERSKMSTRAANGRDGANRQSGLRRFWTDLLIPPSVLSTRRDEDRAAIAGVAEGCCDVEQGRRAVVPRHLLRGCNKAPTSTTPVRVGRHHTLGPRLRRSLELSATLYELARYLCTSGSLPQCCI